jgi:FkbM family methyltransferase
VKRKQRFLTITYLVPNPVADLYRYGMQSHYRFRLSLGYLTHLFKSTTRQDHAGAQALISRHLPREGIAIDVGAHGGQFARLLSRIAPAGLIIAVEPSGYSRAVLRPALWLRGCRNVIVFAAALGRAPGAALLHTPIKARGDMDYGLANLAAGTNRAIAEAVPVVTLDALMATLDLARLDFIKADIEGFEHEFIAGGVATLRRHGPAMLPEMDDFMRRRAGSSLNLLWDDLLSQQFQPHNTAGEPLAARTNGDILWLPAS